MNSSSLFTLIIELEEYLKKGNLYPISLLVALFLLINIKSWKVVHELLVNTLILLFYLLNIIIYLFMNFASNYTYLRKARKEAP